MLFFSCFLIGCLESVDVWISFSSGIPLASSLLHSCVLVQLLGLWVFPLHILFRKFSPPPDRLGFFMNAVYDCCVVELYVGRLLVLGEKLKSIEKFRFDNNLKLKT